MKVRMKATAAGPGVFYMLGAIADVPKEQAAFYVKGGYAEYIAETAETADLNISEGKETKETKETAVETAKPVSKPAAKKKAD